MRNARSANGTDNGVASLGQVYQLICRTSFHLEIHSDGIVNGTRQDSSLYGVLRFIPVAMGLLRIKGVASGKYVCMNKKGKLYGTEQESNECIFLESINPNNWYNTYSSYKYPESKSKRWFLALSNKGKPRRGDRSKRHQKFSQFLRLSVNVDKLKAKYPDDWPRLLPPGR